MRYSPFLIFSKYSVAAAAFLLIDSASAFVTAGPSELRAYAPPHICTQTPAKPTKMNMEMTAALRDGDGESVVQGCLKYGDALFSKTCHGGVYFSWMCTALCDGGGESVVNSL